MTRETKQPKDGRNETSSSRTSSLRDHQKWSRQTTNIDLRNQTPGTQWFAENMTKITKEIGQNQHHQINDTYHIQQSAESPFYPEQRQIQQQNQQHLHQEIYYGNEPSSFSYQQIDQFQDTYFPPYPPQDTLQKVRPF